MMAIKCYVCNSTTDDWGSKLIGLKSQHSNVSIIDLLKQVLNGYQSMRNIDNEMNYICIDCLSKIEDYDLICLRAKQSKNNLYNTLIRTENEFMTKLSEIDLSKAVLIDCNEVVGSTTVDTHTSTIVEPEMISVNEMLDMKTNYNDLYFDDEQMEMHMSYEDIDKICNPIDVDDGKSEFLEIPEIGANVKRSVGRPKKSSETNYECTECTIVFEKRDELRVR